MQNERPSRQELLKRLRSARASKRNGNVSETAQLAKRLSDDPTSALMQMGIDDGSLLRSVSECKTLNDVLGKLGVDASSQKSKKRRSKQRRTPAAVEEEEEEEEEAPPPPTSFASSSIIHGHCPSSSVVSEVGSDTNRI